MKPLSLPTRSDRGQSKECVAFSHRSLAAHEYDAPVALGLDWQRAGVAQGVDPSENPILPDHRAEFHTRHKQAIVRRGVMYLQVSLLSVG